MKLLKIITSRVEEEKEEDYETYWVGDFTQKMLGCIDWAISFNNPENKGFIQLVCSYFQTAERGNLLEILLIINSSEIIWSITEETTEILPI